MKLSISLIFATFLITQPAQALTLTCNVVTEVDHARLDFSRGLKQSIIDSWSPKKQIHVLNLNKKIAHYKNFNLKTEIDSISDDRIQWKFSEKIKQKHQAQKMNVSFKFTYFPKTKKIAAFVDFGGNRVDLESVKGECTETK